MRRGLLVLICATIGVSSFAQELVKDINTRPAGQRRSYESCACSGKVYMTLTSIAHGRELWVTDGTGGGTHLVKDVEPGIGSGVASDASPTCLNGEVYFGGSEGLWKTNGTEGGTKRIFEDFPFALQTFKDQLLFVSDNNKLYSTVSGSNTYNLVHTFELDEEETMTVTSTAAGTDDFFMTFIKRSDATGLQSGTEVWAYDGAVMTQVYDGPGDTSYWLNAIGEKAVFNVFDYEGIEPDRVWITDGTVNGTQILKDDAVVPPNAINNRKVNDKFILIDDNLYEGRTWISDGTAEGTEQVFDDFLVHNVRELGDKIYFIGYRIAEFDFTIRRTDADFSNPLDFATGSSNDVMILGAMDGKMLVAIDNGTSGIELFSLDPSNDDALLIKDINPGSADSFPFGLIPAGDIGVFLADDGFHGQELWRTDGTSSGTFFLQDVNTGNEGSDIRDIYSYNKTLYFMAVDAGSGNTFNRRIYRSDGTLSGTSIVNPEYLSSYYFAGVNKYAVTNGFAKTDLETGVRTSFADLKPLGYENNFGTYVPTRSVIVGNDVYQQVTARKFPSGEEIGSELWKVNPLTNEITLMKDINPGVAGSHVDAGLVGVAVNNKLVFIANDGMKQEPWVSDGTPAGTVKLKADLLYPSAFVSTGTKAFFVSSGQLWFTDGIPANTKQVIPTTALGGVSNNSMAILADKVIFGATTNSVNQLWMSDGTNAGTVLIKAFSPTGTLTRFTSAGSKVYFVEGDSKLWVTDGTLAGTTAINFENTGFVLPDIRTVADDALYFVNGSKIWRTYGSTGMTQLIGSANPINNIYVNDSYVMFIADHLEYGRELFRFPLPEKPQPEVINALSDKEYQLITLFPNPADRTLFVRSKIPGRLKIMDVSGRVLYSQFADGADSPVEVSSFAAGMYFVTIQNETQTHHSKFFKR